MSDKNEAPDGVLDEWMGKILGRSWKTSLLGLLALGCGVAPLIPGLPPVLLEVCRVVLPVATGGGLLAAKDKGVTGGKK